MGFNPFLMTDGYKVSHRQMYPDNTTLVYSNFTPRSNKHAPKGCDKVVVFGTQMTMMIIQEMFDKDFFGADKKTVITEIYQEYTEYLGYEYDVEHIEALWDLGYLPIKVKALPEGTLAPMGVPVLTIYNTEPKFFWLTNFLETLLSNLLWKPMTSATIAYQYRNILTSWAEKTDPDNIAAVDFQAHDFSMRGMDSIQATISSGLGHATSFLGSDSLPVIHGARKFYHEKEGVVYSVPATEHSVMCAGGKEDEIETFRRLFKKFPTGILSIVSDTWDLWKVCTEILPELRDEIMSRDGKIVIRPDSGDPVDIICGEGHDLNAMMESEMQPYEKGVIELLWDIFGGTINEQGYKVLDPHIGCIYGDSITIERAEEICRRLEAKGFASTNIVLGIGSFTYQYNTRDTFGFAMKATYVEIADFSDATESGHRLIGREIFKDPITDDGTKKSAKGLLQVVYDGSMETYIKEGKPSDGTMKSYKLKDQVTWEEENKGCLQVIFEDGKFYNTTTLTEIRERLKE